MKNTEKTKLPWHKAGSLVQSTLLKHSARKRDGLIQLCTQVYTGQWN